MQSGLMMQFIPENGIYVFFRYNKEHTIMVITNNNEKSTELDPKRFREMLLANTTGTDVVSSNVYDLQKSISVPAKSVLILNIK